jgi:hypothetical protein
MNERYGVLKYDKLTYKYLENCMVALCGKYKWLHLKRKSLHEKNLVINGKQRHRHPHHHPNLQKWNSPISIRQPKTWLRFINKIPA